MAGAGTRSAATYTNVELDDAPHDEHGRVAVAVLDPVDLEVAEDGAERGEEAEQEDDDEADLFARADLELQQGGDGHDGHDDVGDDGDHGVGGEGWARGQALSGHGWLPRFVDLGGCTIVSDRGPWAGALDVGGLTGLQARIKLREHPRCPARIATMVIQTTLR